ncbi:hypothetical protein EXIGLDRAFT_511235 [Exidia glandulosa HHB12029]|uniref:Uncharacterized protein n=1 Tax=Exidia glandulosa HHB12029 TaxID=1314781 RepID=A0A165PE13_EXIGL|nr:hypothetical protein EXIGLDRAFT_511235 [Exidia glandulosa HHB12029]
MGCTMATAPGARASLRRGQLIRRPAGDYWDPHLLSEDPRLSLTSLPVLSLVSNFIPVRTPPVPRAYQTLTLHYSLVTAHCQSLVKSSGSLITDPPFAVHSLALQSHLTNFSFHVARPKQSPDSQPQPETQYFAQLPSA